MNIDLFTLIEYGVIYIVVGFIMGFICAARMNVLLMKEEIDEEFEEHEIDKKERRRFR